jgi:tetratricopeptide (TPR) repeat protein
VLLATCTTPLRRVREIEGLPEEERYATILEEKDIVVVGILARDADPMMRNAIARRLHERERWYAAKLLIENLHRDQRTFVCADAIYHLRALFGTDRGYNPNRGYRHQTEKQRAWWDWWAQRFGREPPPPEPAEKIDLAPWRRTDWSHEEILKRWEELAPLAGSRKPEHVRLVRVAFRHFAEAWPEHPDLWNNYALAALNDGRWEEAERAYRRALALRPEDPSLHNDLGILLEGLGRLHEAERRYREACRLAPEDGVCRTNLADVLAALGRADEAKAAYRAAERLAPEKWYYHRLWIRRLAKTE